MNRKELAAKAAAEKLTAYLARVVANAPPLTPEQQDLIASTLRPPRP